MADWINLRDISGKAKEIALNINAKNVKDDKLDKKEISIFVKECANKGIVLEDEDWAQSYMGIILSARNENMVQSEIKKIQVVQADVLHVNNNSYQKDLDALSEINLKANRLKQAAAIKEEIAEYDALAASRELPKKQMCEKLYKKWCSIYKNSPLKQDFFEKMYDLIDVMNIKIAPNTWNREEYSSVKEQALDQVIAIFAGEASLNPAAKKVAKTKGGGRVVYRGLFQLATPGLADLKKYAKAHPEIPGMSNIKQDIGINGFAALSGVEQLDYLVAYIGKCKEYSKIKPEDSITPSQLWTMVKWPFRGKNEKEIQKKQNAIIAVFSNSNIPHGVLNT